jgi:hypothetical protein
MVAYPTLEIDKTTFERFAGIWILKDPFSSAEAPIFELRSLIEAPEMGSPVLESTTVPVIVLV